MAAVAAFVFIAAGCVINGAWAALPGPVDAGEGIILDVSCTAADDCLAGGYASDGSGAIVRRWDGTTWGDVAAPSGGDLSRIDCGVTDRCAALVRDTSILRTASFAVWDGGHRDRDGQKLITIWQGLQLDK